MRVNNIREKTKKAYEIKGVRGVDLSSSPVNVSKNRASYLKNMISEGGTNHKRHGFSAVSQFLDVEDKPMRINGMHIYNGPDGEKLIIHAGTEFYNEDGTKIPCDRSVSDGRSQAFFINEKLYIIGCGGILVYDGDKITGIEPYVPLVMTSADYRFNSAKTIDGVNMLTAKRKMKLDGTAYIDGGTGVFKFDAATDFSKTVSVNVKISVKNNTVYIQSGSEKDPDNDAKYNTVDIDTTFVIKPSDVMANTTNGVTKEFSVEANEFTVNGGKPYVMVEDGHQELSTEYLKLRTNCSEFFFNFVSTPTIENDLNISIDYEGENDLAEQIEGCTFGAVIGDDNNSTRLIISGHKDFSNMCYVSDSFHMEGCAFFPDVNYIAVGDSRPVTGFLRLSDSSLGIFKENAFYRYEFEFIADSQTFATYLKTSGFKSADSVGCINPYVAFNVNSDSLVFTGESVCGAVHSSVDSSVERYLKIRSSRIEKAIKGYSAESLKNAVACEHEGRYYLFIDGDAYIGDTRFKTYESNRLDSSYEYEWWVWDNVSARCVTSSGGKLYLGTDTGLILRENDEYRDIGIIKVTKEGDVLYNSEDGSFVISDDININEGSVVKLAGIRKWLDTVECTLENIDGEQWWAVYTSDYRNVENGRKIYVITTEGNAEDAYIKVTDEDEIAYRFRLANSDGRPFAKEVDRICLYDDGSTEYRICEGRNGYIITEADEPVKWELFEKSPILTIYSVNRVKAEYHTPMLDLGSSVQTKSLYKIALTAGVNDIGHVKIGYETHKNDALSIKGYGAVGFDKLNFNDLTFDLNFAKTYALRVFERNFNFIMLRVEQDENKDCVIEGINLIYVLNNIITGVR